jgi:hypothetical protein
VADVVYKVVETSSVGEDELERIINERVAEADLRRHAVRDARVVEAPAMAFLLFTRSADARG